MPASRGVRRVAQPDSASGVWSMQEAYDFTSVRLWPGSAYSSPQQLSDDAEADNITLVDGTYTYFIPGTNDTVDLYTAFNYVDSKPWVKVFSSPYGSTATLNHVDIGLNFKGFMIQQTNGSDRAYSYFSTSKAFATRNTTGETTTGGNKSGYRVFIGYAGGHGFYNTSQATCSWSTSEGAVGAGFNGSCGSFPNGLRWGLGNSGTPHYTMRTSSTFETWIWWD
jgi:hypothetical protein